MTGQDDKAEAETVRLVTKRLDFLERLSVSPSSKRELVDELACSRSTVDRAVRDLQVAGLIEQTDGGYATTLSGRVSAEQYRQFVRTTTDAVAMREVVDEIPTTAPIDGRALRGASVHRADTVAPYDTVSHLVESLHGATRLRALSEALPHPQYFDAVVERSRTGELAVEGIVSRSLWDAFVEHHPEDVETMLDADIKVRAGDVPPFTLHLIDDGDDTTVQLLVHTDTGALRGIVTNETPEAVEWATALFERVSEDAEPVDELN